MKISKRMRNNAIAICESIALNPWLVAESLQDVADMLFMDVRPVPGKEGYYTGKDCMAVELAAEAWLAVDPEPLGIEDVNDPLREAAAAAMLRDGWSPPTW